MLEDILNKNEPNIELDIKTVSEIRDEFTYIEYHADGLSRALENINNSQFSLIQQINVINNSEETVPGLVISFRFTSDILSIDDIPLPPCYGKINKIRNPFIRVDKNKLDELNESISCQLTISLHDGETSKVYSTETHHFSILPVPQPSSLVNNCELLFAKYITPLSSYIKGITKKAVVHNNGKSIVAYQNDSLEDILMELQAIYLSLHSENIAYQNPPAGAHFTQRVRMAEEIKNDKKATCLDSSILFCSCLLEVGYHPLLVLIEGHAFVGVYLEENLFKKDGCFNSLAEIAPLISSGNERVIFIETTLITSGTSTPFSNAVKSAREKLNLYSSTYFKALDINFLHTRSIYKPIPTNNSNEELEEFIKQIEISTNEIPAIEYVEYDDVQQDYVVNRFKMWERKLLDLTERNKLVNMNIDPRNLVKVVGENIPQKLYDNDDLILDIYTENESKSLGEIENFFRLDTNTINNFLNNSNDNVISAFCIYKVFQNILNKNRVAIEETGAPTLYLVLGILSYASPKKQKKREKNHAPFMLLPIHIKKDKGGKVTHITYDVSDLKINETFFEYFKTFNTDIDFSSLYDFNDITKYNDASQTFKNICGADIVLDENQYFIANLSFANQVMWLDMVKRQSELEKNVIIKSIIENQNLIDDIVIDEDYGVDKIEKYNDFAAPLYYDSSQLKAILDCGAGKSFILDGPPGTGKSQTIVNMITNAFYHNKKILFVAEKKAALDVVYDRLSKIGLGDYCLELHSNKVTKGDFFKKLENIIDNKQVKTPDEYVKKCDELTKKKSEIVKLINSMHTSNEYYMSLYDCIISTYKYEYLKEKIVDLNNDLLIEMNTEKYNRIVKLIEQYMMLTSGIQNFNGSPLKAFGIQNINLYLDKDKILNEMNEGYNKVVEFYNLTKDYFNNLPFTIEHNLENITKLIELEQAAYAEDNFIRYYQLFLTDENTFINAFDYLKEISDDKKEFLKICNIDELLNNDLLETWIDKVRNASGLFKKASLSKVMKVLQPYFSLKLNLENMPSILAKVSSLNNRIKNIDYSCSVLKDKLEIDPYKYIEDIENLINKFNYTKNIIQKIIKFGSEMNLSERMLYFVEISKSKDYFKKIKFEKIVSCYEEYKSCEIKLIDEYLLNKNLLGDLYLDNLIKLLDYASKKENFAEFHEISISNKLHNGFIQEKIFNIVEKVLKGECRSNELLDLFEASLSYNYLLKYFNKNEINDFLPVQFDNQILSYREAIKEYSDLCVESVKNIITSKFINPTDFSPLSSKIGELNKIIKNNGRGISIRGVLSGFSEVVLTYFPCFLMSPLSAAQYLSVDGTSIKQFPKFDIVIFDEASQIPTHEAIGPIARGRALIVAGDPKQMPPSPYFSAGLQIVDDFEEEDDRTKYTDSPSLLDECLAIRMPRHRLNYHYRSKFEKLIQFSNSNFYNDQLYTFPASVKDSDSIKFVYVQPNKPKKDSKITNEEIEAIIEQFKEIYSNPKTWNKSVGIISFNITQADKIMDQINNMLEKNKDIKEKVEEAERLTKEPRFVKSIENVQGDERDIIIISVGFSLSSNGYPSIRGPIVAGDNNGERRLNVIASRSKEKMIIISTIKASQFQDDSLIKNPGTKCLKKFLRYVEEASNEKNKKDLLDENNILYYLQRDLESKNYLVECNVGNSEFKVDLAIKSKESDDYLLGILVDTKPIDNKISCRDKYYVQHAVLGSMKWKIINIYTLEYFRNPTLTINKIVSCINEAQKQKVQLNNCVIEDDSVNNVYFKNNDFTEEGLKLIESIIEQNYPISENILRLEVLKYCKTVDVENCLTKLNNVLNRGYYKRRTFDFNRYFYWNKNLDKITEIRKISGRSILDISKEEISIVIEMVYNDFKEVDDLELYKKIINIFETNDSIYDEIIVKRLKEAIEYYKTK